MIGLVLLACGVATSCLVTAAAVARRLAPRPPQVAGTPPTAIGDAIDGVPVSIVGKLSFGSAHLEGPLSKRPCAAYRLVARGTEPSWPDGPAEIAWDITLESVDFVVRDGTGKALVMAKGHVSFTRPFAAEVMGCEQLLEDGVEVNVQGVGSWEYDEHPDDGTTGYRDSPRRLIVRAAKWAPLLVEGGGLTFQVG